MNIPTRFLFFLFLGGCASQTLPHESLSATADPAQETDRLEARLTGDVNEEVNLLAPEAFAQAKRALADARALQKGGGDRAKWLEAISRGLGALNQAENETEEAEGELEDVLRARRDARVAGAMDFVVAYPEAEKKLLELARTLERGDDDTVEKSAKEVEQDFRAVEISAIANHFLGGARTTMEQAKQEGAGRYVPGILSLTEEMLKAAEVYIAKHPHQTEQLREHADRARFSADRLLHLTREARAFSSTSPEQLALWMEQKIATLSDAINVGDNRDKNLDEQVSDLRDKLAKLAEERDTFARRARRLSSDMEGLRARRDEGKEQGASEAVEREFARKLEEVRGLFTPAEAEVVRNGERLRLRLRGLHFGEGSSTLAKESLPLLAKVEKAIQIFGSPRVVIAGRTTAAGGAVGAPGAAGVPGATAQRLSLARARSVKEYLLATHTVPEEKVVAQGVSLGDSGTRTAHEPSSDIDVLIDPEPEPEVAE